jgi:hypothetical protein
MYTTRSFRLDAPACSHNDLVDAGSPHFTSMQVDHHIVPGLDHNKCMVDLLGQVGRHRVEVAARRVPDTRSSLSMQP